MPLDNEKLKKVYSTLKEGGYDQDYNTFVKGFSGNENYGNRKQVYDLLTKNGAQVGKNYADFMQRLYTPSQKQTQVQQPRVNRGSMVRAVTDPLNARGIGGVMQNINKVQGVVKKAEKEKANGYQPRFDGVTKRNTETKIPTLADMKPMPTFEPAPHFETEKSVDADGKIVSKAKPKQIFDGSGQPKYVYQDSFTGKTYDPNDSDPHTQEMIKRGEDVASYVQEAPMAKVTDKDLIGLASDIDKRMHEIALQRNAEAGTSDWSGLDMPRGGGALVGNWYTSTQNGLLADEEYKTLGIAQGALARAHKMVEEAEKSKREGNFSGFIKGAGRGFVDGVFDPETWDFGALSLAEAGYIKNALGKFDSGQRLSKDEKILLDAKAMEMAVNAFYGSDLGRGYKAGKVTAEAIPFMIEMAINPASGAGKSAASMLTRYALKRFGKKGLVKASKKAAEKAFVRAEERALAKGLSKSAAKAAGERAAARATTQTLKFQAAKTGARVLGDVAGASAMAATTGAMRTAADAVSRHSGDVKFDVDDKGNIVFAGHDKGDDWGTAVKKAFANTAIENYSELFGAYFAPIGSFVGKAGEKILSKLGLGKVAEMLGKLSSSDIAKAVKRIEEKGQFNGVIGEDLEEQVGGIMNALIVGDQTLDTADGTGVFNMDNQIDTFLGVGLMGGIFSAARLGGGLVGGQGNLEARRAVRQAGIAALKDFKGKELIWDQIKTDVDNASNDQLKQVVKNIVTDGGLSDENKTAALQYVRSSMQLRGVDAIRPLTKEEEEADAHNVQEEAAHNRGLEADAQERKDIAIESADPNNAEAQQAWAAVEQRIDDDATQMAEALREKALQTQHTDGSFHTGTLKEKDEHGEGKQVFIVSGHVQMTPDGTMIDHEASDKVIVIFDPSTGERKMIDPSSDFGLSSVDEPTTSEELDASIERNRQGFIQAQLDEARGTIRLSVGQQFVLPDGNEAVVVALDESGEDITAMLADGTQVNIQRAELQQAHDEQALAEYRQRKGTEEPMTEDEATEQSEQGAQVVQIEGAPSSYEPDMELVVRNENGGESQAIVMGRVRYEGGEFVPDENGGIVEYFMDGEVRHEQIGKLNDRVVSHTDAAQVIEEEEPPAEDVQTEEETSLQEEESMPAEKDTTPLEEEELAPAAEEDAKEDNAMPMRDNGEEDWEATTPERAHTYIYNEAGLSQREGNEFVAAQKEAAQRALNKAKSAQAPRVGTSIRQYNEAKAKHQEKIENAQRVLDYWNAVQDIQVEIQHKEREQKEAEDAKAHEEAAAQMLAEFEARKVAEAERAEVGNENPMPAITKKWNNSEKIDGHSDEIVLPDGTSLKGHYVLHESGASSPSHNAETWKMTEGFPMDANDNSVNDRDYEHDKDAQAHTEEIARNYDQRALQSVPVVSQDGVVLSGNGRTMAGELAARDNTDKAYIDYLKGYARKFGFTPEQVEAMEHPRVSFVPDEAMPYTAETFARFNQQEMKSQSKTEQAVKLGKTVSDDAFRAIVRTINGFDTLGDFYNDPKESIGAVYDLHNAGVIPQTQLAEMVDGIRGQDRLSAVGREYLENMLIGKAFANEPDVLRMLTAEPAMRQTIITALGEIVDNIALGEDWALQGELADAIKLCFEARKDGAKYGDVVSAFASQGVLFADPDKIQTKADFRNVTMLMLADALNDKRVTLLKTALQLYNNEARLSASGQTDMFAGGIQSREEILRNVINYIKENYGKSKEIEAAKAEAMERRKAESLQEDGDSEQSTEGSERRTKGTIQDGAQQVNSLKEDEDLQGKGEESPTDFTPSPRKEGEDLLDYAARVDEESKADHKRKQEEAKVNTLPSDAQKEAGNYKKGHIKVDGMDITIEQPKGSIRTGKDASGKEWRSEMHNTYGYIRGTESVDGDHIDIFLSDNPADGNVFVVDQVKKDGSFDEHKVMYGFTDIERAKQAYLSNYEKGWQGLGNITEVSKDEFKKWIDSSKRKTKPFAEYTSVKTQDDVQNKKPTEENVAPADTQTEENNAHNSKEIMHGQKNVQLQQVINAYENAERIFTKLYNQQAEKGTTVKAFESKQWRDVIHKRTELQKALSQLNYEEQRELLKQTTHKETKREIEKALDAALKEEQRSIEYNTVLDRQDLIRPIYKEEKKPISVTEFVETDKKEAERHPVLTGVYHDDGYVVGTNAYILLARKEDYDKSLEGKTTNKKGEVIDAKYPNWRAVVDGSTPRNSWGINLDELHAFTRGVLAKLKADGAKKSTIDSATIAFKDTDGKIIVCYAKTLDKALRGAKSIGATDFGNTPKTFAQAQTEKGYVICPTISTDHDIDNNCFVYAPKEAARQQTTTPLTNDTRAKQKATEAVLTALNKAGIEVVQATEEQAQAMLGNSKAEQLKTPQGTVYGWAVNGKIYLTKDGLNPNTPIHEYTHLWADAMMKHNKKEWQSVKELLRDTPAWDEVLKDKNYQDIIDNEDAIASEALSRISGKKNAAKMEAEAQKMIDESKDYVDKAKATSLLERMKNALEKFWDWVGKDLFGIKDFSSIDEVTDRVLHDLVNGADLEVVKSDKTEKQQVSTGSEEERAIIERAKIEGTYMKAPNDKPTNLNEKQWAQVRTKAFKAWFGDWEKAARIEKLRKSKPVVISGNEYKGKYELNRDSAKAWIKENLRGEYTITDTEEKVVLTKVGANKVTSHGMNNKAHLQSIAIIPQLIRHAIFVEERPNEKNNNKYDSYRYYVCGLKIGTTDYTVKLTIGVKSGKKYYDHALTEIEKGELLDRINDQADKKGFTTTGGAPLQSYALSIGKDTKLVSILQTNSSKVFDENGEPMVVYHGTLTKDLHQFSKDFIDSRYSFDEKGFFFISNKQIAKDYSYSEFDSTRKGEVIETFLSIKHPLLVDQKWGKKNGLGNNVFKDNDVIEFWDNYQALILEESENNDGVIITDGNTTMDVAFDPNQIKIAVNNNGEFSLESDDIRFRKEGGENQEVLRDKALRDREAMRNEAVQLAEKLHTPVNVVEDANKITHSNKEIEARRRKAKGWYDVSTGEVVVVLANHKDAADVAATISHEVIAHKGLRELVGEAHYDEFLDEVYNHLRGDLKREIDDAAGRAFLDDVNKSGDDVRDYKRHKRIAVDELFGSLAEKPFEEFSESERNLWQKIKEFAKKLLDRFLEKLKLPKWFELGDNELRYMLWRSKERLERGKEDPIDQARDIVKREDLGLTNEPLNKVSVTARNFDEMAERYNWNWDFFQDQGMEDLYDIAPNVTTKDYYLGTFAEFELVATNDPTKWDELKQQDGFRLEHSPKSDSEYLINDETGEIYRKSDHWGVVSSCRWILNGMPHQDDKGKIFIGKSNVNDFKREKKACVVVTKGKREAYYARMREVAENIKQALGDKTIKFTATTRKIVDENLRMLIPQIKRYDEGEKGDLIYKRNRHGHYVPLEILKTTNNNPLYDDNSGEDDVLYRDSNETRDIWLDQSMGLHERTTAAAARLANNHRDNKVFMQDAMRAIGANLTDLRKAMRLQKDFDRTTAKRVYDLARILMEMGYLRGLNQQEVSKLLSVMKNSIGKQNIDNDVQKLMDLMVNHQLKQSKSTLESLERIKGSKVNAKGVEVQGALDAEGQAIMAAMKAAKDIVTPCAGKTEEDNGELTAWGQALEDVQERIGSEDNAIAENAALEYQGMMLAQQWFDEIKQSELEEATLRKELNHAPSTTPTEDRKGEAYKEYIGNLKQAIQQNKIDRAQAYMNLVGQLTESLRESIEGAKGFKLREKARISAIQRDANLDMEGRPAGEHYVPDWKANFVNNSFVQFGFSPLLTYDQMFRMFGNKSANGEGFLYNRFVRDGWTDARQKEAVGVREKFKALDDKAAEIFGGEIKTWGDLKRFVSKLPAHEVAFKNGGEVQTFELTQGHMLYIYMANKMLDGRMKLAKMGISSEDVERLSKEIDPRLIKLADWLQEEFLVQTRNEYNETHKRIFGASMAAIENYFPLKIRSNARTDKAEDLDNPGKNSGISTTTGSIIKRRRNSLALDLLNADALDIILDHVQEMEHWNAFVEFDRDLNTLRTYKHFRNQVENITSVYGSGKMLWKNFNTVCQIASGKYVPPRSKLDTAAVNLAKGVTAAKVSFRLFTALKQFLSFPAYFPEVKAVHIAKCLAHPKESWDWCMENLPIFNERWNSRMSGDPRLVKTNMDWKMWRTNAAEIASRIGMTPNAFIDALTVSLGARAMYLTRKGQYLRDGYTEEIADKKAKQDAEILYNQTQQSSEGAFLSPMQVDRGWLSVLFSIFRNSSMAYTRQLYDAIRNLSRNLTERGRAESIQFMKNQYKQDGFDDATAERNAKRKLNRQIRKDILRVATFGYILQFAWNLGAYLPYLLFGNDDDEKEAFWQDIFAHSYFGSLEGLTGGDVLSQGFGMLLTGNFNPDLLKKDMPLTSDFGRVLTEAFQGQHAEAISDMINLIVQSGIGVNPQSITDAVIGIIDACGDDPALANEATIFVARVLQVPQSQIEKLYFDEVGLMGSELSKYTPTQLAERYARYKVKRGRFYAPWEWDDKDAIRKKMKDPNKKIKERIGHMSDKQTDETISRYEEVYNSVDKKMKAYRDALKDDYAEAAEIMTEIQKDPESLSIYQRYTSMDRQLDKLAKMYLKAKSAKEMIAYKKMMITYRDAMAKSLEAKGEAAQEKAMADMEDLLEGFAEEQAEMYGFQ
ncbi:ADP-ribosyltransferase-containing protein [Alloprevotella tannerae]